MSAASSMMGEDFVLRTPIGEEATEADDVDDQMLEQTGKAEEKKGETKGEKKGEEKEREKKQGEDYSIENQVWLAAEWARQCSKHLSHVEKRLMESEFLGHEVVRQLMSLMASWDFRGDWGWLLRNCQDIAVRTLRQLQRLYGKGVEEGKIFEDEAMHLVRLYLEESYHRTLLTYEKPSMRAAMSSMMLTMHRFEEKMMSGAGVPMEMRFFSTMTEDNMKKIAALVRFKTMTVQRLPSFVAVMSCTSMRHEVFSLIPCEVTKDMVAMTKDEQVALIEEQDGKLKKGGEFKMVNEGPSLFDDIFFEY